MVVSNEKWNYEWLIKFFADSAGKKAGEFYTPAEVVRICVEIADPQPYMSVYDPTVGSGGMLIQSRDYLQECGHNPRDLSLAGQESIGTTWSICKMNMLLHSIAHADIRQEDTLKNPAHMDDANELRFASTARAVRNSWYPREWQENGAWLRMFQNARKWVG